MHSKTRQKSPTAEAKISVKPCRKRNRKRQPVWWLRQILGKDVVTVSIAMLQTHYGHLDLLKLADKFAGEGSVSAALLDNTTSKDSDKEEG